MSKFSFQFFSPLILFFLMLVDGQITQFLAGLNDNGFMAVSHLFLIVMMYTVWEHSYGYMMCLSFVLGIIYDSYYIGVYGIASFLLPLITLFVYNIKHVVFENRLTRLSTMIIIVTSFEVAVGLIVSIFRLAQVDLALFVVKQLAPTLLLNAIYIVLLQNPLERFYRLDKVI